MRTHNLFSQFVDSVPEVLTAGVLYVCIRYATVAHLCCCGCGHEVITPLTPTDWKLTFDGESVSLSPSIGNWSFDCRSHYWIRHNRVEWAPDWSMAQIDHARALDREAKAAHADGRHITGTTERQRTRLSVLRAFVAGMWRKIR